ncbi:MAG: hypothetical protein ACLTR6_11475 [Clostridium fessum]
MLYGSKGKLGNATRTSRRSNTAGYRYNVKEGKIVCQAEGENAHIEYAQGSGTKKVNDLGRNTEDGDGSQDTVYRYSGLHRKSGG